MITDIYAALPPLHPGRCTCGAPYTPLHGGDLRCVRSYTPPYSRRGCLPIEWPDSAPPEACQRYELALCRWLLDSYFAARLGAPLPPCPLGLLEARASARDAVIRSVLSNFNPHLFGVTP